MSEPIFVALDFETADYQADSACSIGLVQVQAGQILNRWHWYIRPPRREIVFSYLHGITWDKVKDCPTFAELWPELEPIVSGARRLVAHNASFDRRVLQACLRSVPQPLSVPDFLCTVQLARKAWKLFPTKLTDVSRYLNFPLKHHDALSDAEACARVIIKLQETGQDKLFLPSA